MGTHNAATEGAKLSSRNRLSISHALEFALSYLQNTPLFNHALECDHMHNKHSHVTKIVDVQHQTQPPRLSLNSRSTCFGSMLFTKSEYMITQAVLLSSPVSTLYAWNAWDHDPSFGNKQQLAFSDSGFPAKAE